MIWRNNGFRALPLTRSLSSLSFHRHLGLNYIDWLKFTIRTLESGYISGPETQSAPDIDIVSESKAQLAIDRRNSESIFAFGHKSSARTKSFMTYRDWKYCK